MKETGPRKFAKFSCIPCLFVNTTCLPWQGFQICLYGLHCPIAEFLSLGVCVYVYMCVYICVCVYIYIICVIYFNFFLYSFDKVCYKLMLVFVPEKMTVFVFFSNYILCNFSTTSLFIKKSKTHSLWVCLYRIIKLEVLYQNHVLLRQKPE